MKHYNIKRRSLLLLLFIVFVGGIISCTDMMNDYKKYAEGGEIVYTGKIDSVKIYGGKDQVLVKGLFIADPKISVCKIYWDGRKDSVVVPVVRSAGIDSFKTLINIPEGIHSFEFRTFDKTGNISVPVFASGASYGAVYEAGLVSRAVTITSSKAGLVLTFSTAESGNVATEVTYTNNLGMLKTISIPVSVSTFTILDNVGAKIVLKSSYIPANGIYTFYSPAVTKSFNPFLGTYLATGVFHHPANGDRPISETKILSRVTDEILECNLGDLGSSGFLMRLAVNKDLTVTLTPAGVTPNIDQHWGPNFYDPLKKEFHLFYSYNTSAPRIIEETLTLQ